MPIENSKAALRRSSNICRETTREDCRWALLDEKMSSMLEEFQDIDNFQHIDNFQQGQLEEPEPQFFDFKEQPFDEAVEFNNFDYERDSGFQFGFNQQAPKYHRAAPGFFGDIDSQESHMLPPGDFGLMQSTRTTSS